MSTDWPTMTLRAAGVALIDCVHKTPEAALDGYPYVTIPQMVNGRIDFSTARRTSSSDFEAWTKKARPKAWDVVLSRRCNPGETVVVAPGEEFALGQNLVLLRADGSHVFPQFRARPNGGIRSRRTSMSGLSLTALSAQTCLSSSCGSPHAQNRRP